MAETQVKQKESKKGRIILIILIIIILLLTLFVGCFAQKLLHETNLKEQAKESAERYLKEHPLQFDGDVSIPMNLLKEANYLGYFDSKCLDASYVVVRKNGDKLEYEPIIICDSAKAILKLNGDALKQVEVGEDYIEEGATIEGDSVHDVIIDSNVDTSKKGTYGVTYKIPDTDIPPVLRVVEVVDTTKPIITLKNSDILYLAVGDTYTEPGYKAIDNYDGDITDQVKITGTANTKKAGTYTIIYKVTDSSNNTTEVTRQVIVRENVPTINLKGYGTVYVDVFGSYTEEGYTATDIKGNNLTKQVIVSGDVNTNVVGDYVITYKVTSSNGATATVRRTVKVVDNAKPEITLNGDKEITLEWGKDTYVEMGATATDNYDGDISARINITGVFNPNKVGTYYLAYTVTDASGNKSSVQRIVKVVDTEAPTLTLKGNDPLYVEAGSEFTDPGVEATDNYDSSVKVETSGIINVNVLGNYTLIYTATDNSGNKTIVTRNIVVQDTTAPVITLKGDATTNVEFGTSYVEPGYIATDNYDHFVQNNVVIGGDTVDTNVEGTYTITYNVTDNNGNVATAVTRTVIVKDTKAPTVTLTSEDLNKFVKNVNVTLKAYDTNHGLQSVRYAWKEVEPTNDEYADLTYTENENATLSFSQNGTYYLWVEATDLSGNITVEKIGPFKNDVSAPEVSFTPNGSIGQNATVIPTVTDNFSGVKETFYAWSNSNSIQPSEFTVYTGGELTKDVDGTYYLWIKAVDNATNETVAVSNAYIIDNAYPSITFTYPTTSNVVKTAVVDVTAMGNSGKTITKVEYQWIKTDVQPTTGYTEWTDYDANHTITMPDDLDGTYYLWIKATDSYGLVSYNSSRMITIDNTEPTITVTPETSTTPVQSIDVNITIVEENVESILWAVSTDSNINNVTLTNSLTELTSTITLENLNGTYYLHIGVLDKAGNYKDYTSQAFEFDNTAPIEPTITFDENWTNQPVSITINGTDIIEYSFDNQNWTTYTGPFTVDSNKTIYAKASDVAGNISGVVSKTVTNIDTDAPTLTLTYETELTNKLSVDYSVADTDSGIKTIYYAWSTSDTTEPEFTETLTDATGTITKNDTNGTYALWIKVVDNAGNATIKHTSLLTLDKEKPVINITTGNGTSTPVTSQNTTVSIMDDSSLTIEYIYSTSSEALDNTANWTSWYNYDITSNNALTLNDRFADGTYYLHIKATDASGNSEYVISNAFLLVNSKPNVIYNPATNLDYQQQISSTVTATLENATIQGLYYAWSTATTADAITDWTSFNSGDTLTKNDATGAYYLYIKVVDNVDGNRETIIKSTGTFNLDKSNVAVSFDPNGTGTPVKEAETEIIARDIHSGIDTIKYAWGTSHTESPDLSQFVDYELGTTLTKTTTDTYETYYLWVYAKDAAGNENYTVSDAFIIDNSYPTINLDPNRSNPVNDLTVSVTIDVDSNKTLTGIYYAWDTNSNITDDTVWTEWNMDAYYANPKLSQTGLNGTYYLHVKVVDNHGMEATKSTYALEFDNTPADVTITPSTNTTPVQTIKPTITVTETPSGNDYTVYYSFTQEANSTLATYTEWTDFMGQGSDTLTLGDSTTNGTWYLHVKVIDEAFNETYKTATYEFDNEAPDAPSIGYDTTWTNQDVVITISGDETLEYSFDNQTWLTYDGTDDTTKPRVSANNTTIYARSKDAAGNTSDTVSATIENIDKTEPVVIVTPNTTDWTNQNVTLTVDITEDGLSPIKSIRWAPIALTKEEYQAGRGNAVSLDTKKFENGVIHEYVEIYVEDEAGNVTIIHTSVINIDKELPVITVNPTEVTINEGTTYNVLTGVGATDNVGFGDNELTYTTNFDNEIPGTYTVTYSITDIAGNTATATRTIIVKDITDPSLTLTYEEGSHQELEVEYEASDNVNVKDIYYAWSTSDTEEPTFVDTLTDIQGTITKNDVEGTYALWVKVVDEAGNATVKHTSLLTLDKTAPIVTITPDSKENPVQNVSPIVKVDEDNTYNVYYSFTQESNFALATYTKWENFKGDDTDTKTFGDTTTNGNYYVHIKVVDAAGNTTYATATYEFDNIAPDAPSISYDTAWTNQDVVITISGDETLEYSFDNQTWLTYDETDDTTKPIVSVNNTTIYARSQDVAGNISDTVSATIENIDKTPADVTITPDSKENPVQNVSPIVKVDEDNTYDVYYSFTQESDFALATYTKWENFKGDDTDTKTFGDTTTNGNYYVHIKVVDAAGNTTYATATYEFDNIAPTKPSISYDTTWTNQDVVITISGDETLEYSFDNQTWITYDGTDATTKPIVSVNNTTIYARSQDAAGNISDVESVTIENIDKTEPTFIVTPNTTDWTNQDVTLTLTITEDGLSPIKSIRWAPIALTKEDYQVGRGFEVNLTTRKFTQGISREYVEIYVEDEAGNVTIISTSVINIDKEAPDLTVDPATVTIDEGTVYDVLEGVSATDNVGIKGDIEVTTDFDYTIPGTYTVTYKVSDLAGTEIVKTRTIIVKDITKPNLELVGDSEMTIEVGGTYTEKGATATDNVDGNLDANIVISGSVNTAVVDTYTITYTVEDAAGNSITITRTVNVVDTTKPVITLNGNETVTIEVGGTYTEQSATASDNYDGNITSKIITTGNVNTAVVGTYTVRYNVVDANGNHAEEVTRTVNIVDTTKPVITLNGNAIINVEVFDTYTDLGATATDNYDGDITSQIATTITPLGKVDTTVLGTYTIKYNVVDANGNIAEEVTRIVNVVDTTDPELKLKGTSPVTIEVGGTYNELGATAVDNYDGNLTDSITVSSTVDTTAVGTYYVRYSVTDNSGNTATILREVIVVDTTKPVITLNGETNVTIEVGGTYTEQGATATDNYDGNLTNLIEIEGEVDTTIVDTYEITYTVEDSNGNSQTVTRTVNVVDTTAPEIELVGDSEITIEIGSDYEELGATASDNYDGDLTDFIDIDENVDTTTVGTYTITYKVEDENGNSASITRTVNVADTTKPVITLNGDSTVTIEVGSTYEDLGATATDPYYGNITNRIKVKGLTDLDTTRVGTYKIKYNVTDINGNSAQEVIRTVKVVDTEIPTITLNGDPVVTIQAGSTYTDLGATATDSYDGDITNSIVTVNPVDTNVLGTYTITYNVVDSNGNHAETVTRTVNVIDTDIPVITLKGDSEVIVDVFESYTDDGVSIVDNYDPDLTSALITTITSDNGLDYVDTSKVGTYTITYNVTDTEGNAAETVTRIVKVVDKVIPTITLTDADEDITLTLGQEYIEPGYTANDNYDEDITANVIVKGEVNIHKVGTYTLTYTVKDSSNNEAVEVTRTITILEESIENLFRDNNGCEAGTDCFSTPNAEDNYFWYSGYLFRAFKSNKDGSIKLITEGSISSLSFDDDSSIFKDSIIQNWLNTTFYNSLHNADSFLTTSKFCNWNTTDATNNRTTCAESALVESKVGLLTLFEYNLVGGENSYLNNQDYFFTMTRYGSKSIWAIRTDGTPSDAEMVESVRAIRPVITLATGIKAVEGEGTKENPYRLAGDTAASGNTALNDRYTGEYVKFNDQVWRIVSTDNNGTKMILDSYLKDAEGNVIEVAYGETARYSESNVLKELTKYYQENNNFVNTSWYWGSYTRGKNPIGTSLRTDGNYSNHQYGLIRVGELMSGKSATLENQGMTYWTMTENTEENTVWHISSTGGASYDDLSAPRAIRPVIKIASNRLIVSGNGTSTSPYIVR